MLQSALRSVLESAGYRRQNAYREGCRVRGRMPSVENVKRKACGACETYCEAWRVENGVRVCVRGTNRNKLDSLAATSSTKQDKVSVQTAYCA